MKGRWGGSKSKAEKRGLCVSRLQAIGSSPLLPPMPTPRMPRSKAAKKAQTQYAKAQSQGRNRTESGKHTQGEAERRCAHHFDRRAHVCMYAPSATDFLFSVAPDPG